MNGFEFLAWVASIAIIFVLVASILIFRLVRRENIKAVEEFKKRKNKMGGL